MRSVLISFSLSAAFYPSIMFARNSDQKQIVMNAIGDSISTGFNARNFGDNRGLSWSTGEAAEVNSHLKRLQGLGYQVTAFNNAQAGAKITELPGHIDSVIANGADFVAVTLGANDLCSWPANHGEKLAEFKDKMIKEFDRATASRPTVKILLSPVPNLHNLWEVGKANAQCQSRWDLFNICAPLLNSKRTAEERQAFMSRWQDVNAALEEVAEVFPKNILFPKETAATVFELKHVSTLDCFHPSIAGQNLLSLANWIAPEWEEEEARSLSK
jgi:lysophospholipase L1-like esterase